MCPLRWRTVNIFSEGVIRLPHTTKNKRNICWPDTARSNKGSQSYNNLSNHKIQILWASDILLCKIGNNWWLRRNYTFEMITSFMGNHLCERLVWINNFAQYALSVMLPKHALMKAVDLDHSFPLKPMTLEKGMGVFEWYVYFVCVFLCEKCESRITKFIPTNPNILSWHQKDKNSKIKYLYIYWWMASYIWCHSFMRLWSNFLFSVTDFACLPSLLPPTPITQ